MNYRNGYIVVSDGVIKQSCPAVQSIDTDNCISIYNFTTPPKIDYNDLLINNVPGLQTIYTKRCYGIDSETGAETSTPTQQGLDDHIPAIIQSMNKNFINGSSPRFAQRWQVKCDEKN